MNPTLLAKLKALNPTVDYRIDDDGFIIVNGVTVAYIDGLEPDNRSLINLAPAMRQDLLKMEEERISIKQIAEDLLERIISADTNVVNSPSNADRVISVLYEECLKLVNSINPTQP